MSDQGKQISEMLSMTPPVDEEVPKQDEEVKNDEVEQPDEPEIGDEKGTGDEGEPEGEKEKEDLSAIVAELRQKIASLEAPRKIAEPEKEEEYVPQELTDLVTQEEWEQAQTSHEAFAKLMSKVYNRARQDTLRDIPRVVQKTTKRVVQTENAVNEFWNKNPELKEHRKFVGYIANEVESENPGATIEEILAETAKRSRRNLRLGEQARETEKQRAGKAEASFARKPKGQRGRGEDEESPLQKQINQLIAR